MREALEYCNLKNSDSFTLRVGGCWYWWIWQFERLIWSALIFLNFCLNCLKQRQFFLILMIHVKKPFLDIGGAWFSCLNFSMELPLIQAFTSAFTSVHYRYWYKSCFCLMILFFLCNYHCPKWIIRHNQGLLYQYW